MGDEEIQKVNQEITKLKAEMTDALAKEQEEIKWV